MRQLNDSWKKLNARIDVASVAEVFESYMSGDVK